MKTIAGSKNWSFRNRVSPEKSKYARNMRNSPTEAESVAWKFLRRKGAGFNFTRQKVVLGWIVDFYCPHVRLVVEIDGPYHETKDKKIRDEIRDSIMSNHGFSVLRFKNDYVIHNSLGFLSKIKLTIKELDT